MPRKSTEADASLFEAPFEHLKNALYDPIQPDLGTLRQARTNARDTHAQERWWEPYWPRPEMRRQIEAVCRYIVTPETAEHRLFYWLRSPTVPDKNLIAFPKADNTTFGILHSRFHAIWAVAIGNRIGKGNQSRYNNLTTFETFPFPEGLTPDIPAVAYANDPRAQAIGEAARELDTRREAWLNPPDLVTRVPEVVPGYPDRLLPIDDAAAKVLKTRTLTNLYNARPAWLAGLHDRLDAAVADAYGWGGAWQAGMTDEAILARLFALNQERSQAERGGASG